MEVFTLDSGSCAPCQYMMESVQRTAPEFHRRIEFIERSVNHKDAIARMKLIGVGNIPTILIDGETAFASLIPSDHELISAIRARVERKGLG
ncbi:MAG: thioredoxin family protein [Armatimonadetes bacterium]|nr:thioredoxin family protein [Armatimonadota bacterium]